MRTGLLISSYAVWTHVRVAEQFLTIAHLTTCVGRPRTDWCPLSLLRSRKFELNQTQSVMRLSGEPEGAMLWSDRMGGIAARVTLLPGEAPAGGGQACELWSDLV
jgi:hypothetical protein